MRPLFLFACILSLTLGILSPVTVFAQGAGGSANAMSDPLNLTAPQKVKMDAINSKYFSLLQAIRKKYKPEADAIRAKYTPQFAQLRAKKLKPENYTIEMIKIQTKMQADLGPITKKIQLEQKPIEEKKNQEILTILDAKQKETFKKQLLSGRKK